MVQLSVLDLAPIMQGGDARQAFASSRALAQHAEQLGYNRYWLAEHHNMPGIASAATSLAIQHVAAATSTIRVGAGGIMLPNHAPLIIAEQFGTLDALFPGRIDLGLGRAPGTDQLTMRALRRGLANTDTFPDDVQELMHYFKPAQPGQAVRAVPGAGAKVGVWILGSSLFGARLAAALGLPYAFASHFAPGQLKQAIQIYRETYRPSKEHPKPYLMLGATVIAANTDDEARFLLSSLQQAIVNLRTGRADTLQPPIEDYEDQLGPMERAMLDDFLSRAFFGSVETVKKGLREFVRETGADELMITSQIFDQAARHRSFAQVAELRSQL